MSTGTQTQTLEFNTAEPREMPKLHCVGTVTEVGEPKIGASGKYISQPIKVTAEGTGTDARLWLIYRPDWLTVGFKPDSLKDQDGGKFAHKMYCKLIAAEDQISFLEGLAGSPERFSDLSTRILSLPVASGTDGPDMDAVAETLREFFNNNLEEDGSPKKVVYTLKQQKQGIKQEDGSYINRNTKYYEVERFHFYTDATLKRLANKSAKSGGSELFCIECQYNGDSVAF